MNVLGALLIILNVVTVVGPVATVAVVYQNHPEDMVIPPQVKEMLAVPTPTPPGGGPDDAGNSSNVGAGTFFTGDSIQLPWYVSSQSDLASRSVIIVVGWNNPINYDLTINSLSATIMDTDGFGLGTVILVSPVTIPAGATSTLSVVCQWTQDAENHFQTAHPDAKSIDVNLVGLTINVNGITVQAPEPYRINVPIN